MSWDHWIVSHGEKLKHDKPSPWEAYIDRIGVKDVEMTTYDKLCELCIEKYELASKSRKLELKDRVHYFLIWWMKNKKYMKKYDSKANIGRLLNSDHTSVIHYTGTSNSPARRKKSKFFEENTFDIADFLN